MAVLKAGTRLKSVVCKTEVMVVAAPKEDVELTCGGASLVDIGADVAVGATISDDAKRGHADRQALRQ